jgi:hypothetical protein
MNTTRTTIGDVLGSPDTWPDYSYSGITLKPGMHGAWISMVAVYDGGLAISTRGGAGGPTYSVFRIANHDLRKRTMRALRVGMAVDTACLLAI